MLSYIRGMSPQNWIILQTFNWISEALALKGRLESEGIPCRLPEEHIGTINPGATGMQVHLMVPAEKLEEAKALIVDFEKIPPSADLPMEEPWTCPACGAHEFVEKNGGTLRDWIAAVLGSLALVPMRPQARPRICAKCGKLTK